MVPPGGLDTGQVRAEAGPLTPARAFLRLPMRHLVKWRFDTLPKQSDAECRAGCAPCSGDCAGADGETDVARGEKPHVVIACVRLARLKELQSFRLRGEQANALVITGTITPVAARAFS